MNNMPHSQPPLVLDKDLEAAVPTPRLDGTTLLPKVQEQLKFLINHYKYASSGHAIEY